MRHALKAYVVAGILALAATLSADTRLFGADPTSPGAAKPSLQKTAATMEKLKNLGTELGRTLDLAIDLFSGNGADSLSQNKTALLSGNSPKLLSENTTPILSGNTFSLFSNIKVEIHIDNSGNNVTGGSAAPPAGLPPRR